MGWRAQVRRAMTAPGQPGETDLLLYFYLHSLCYHLVAPGLVTGSYWCAHFKWQPWDKSSPPLTTPHYPALPSLPSPNTCTHTTSRAAHLSKYPAPIHSSPETRNSNHIHPNPFLQNSNSHFTFPRHKRLFTYYLSAAGWVHSDNC